MSNKLMLVTGANGYIAIHIVKKLLTEGYSVRGTVRNLQDNTKTMPLKKIAEGFDNKLELIEADLLDANAWKIAVKDCSRVFHVASPLPVQKPNDEEEEIVKPALEGTLNILKAAANESSVERVVYTGSGLSVFGYRPEAREYSEKDWPDFSKLTGYAKSKYLAEKAAWNFVEEKKKAGERCFELAVVLPVFVLGPTLHTQLGTSETRFLSVFDGKLEKLPNAYFGTCDVRDVAQAHLNAAFIPEAAGLRHLIASEPNYINMKRWSDILNAEFASKGFIIPTEVDENASLGIYDNPNADKVRIDTRNMREVLKLQPTEFKSTILDMAYSLIENGNVKSKKT